MHIVVIILGLLGAGAFWWYRLKMMNDAAGEIVDTVGRVRGSMRRKKIRQQNELSPLTAIDDPVVAAATLIAAIVMDDVALNPNRESALRQETESVADPAKLEETVIYAKWAAGQIDDASTVIDKLGPFLSGKLTESEKIDLVAMVRRVALTEGPPLASLDQRMRRLRQKIGLQID